MSGLRRKDLQFHALSEERWDDFVRLFGPRGACAGCWCMFPLLSRAAFEHGKGAGNRRAMRARVGRGEVPGILAYHDGEPVGWCAVGPRASYSTLSRSRILAPLDARAVWSIVCLFVRRDMRGRDLTRELLRAAARHVASCGGDLVEGYPVDPRGRRMPDAFVWHGLASAYAAAGFRECARRSPTRPIMRRRVRPRHG